jgi:hypothetical protein
MIFEQGIVQRLPKRRLAPMVDRDETKELSKKSERGTGFEPATLCLGSKCSAG